MRARIAIVTGSGKAYYQLVSELRRRRIHFISVAPSATIPLSIEVVITTGAVEEQKLRRATILAYNEATDPSIVIEETLKVIRGKRRYDSIIVGIDPGKEFEIAVMGDRSILETKVTRGVDNVALEVLRMIEQYEGRRKIVKIGDGAESYGSKLIKILDERLPSRVDLESVEEKGTTRSTHLIPRQRNLNEAASAIKISMRRGRRIARRGEVKNF